MLMYLRWDVGGQVLNKAELYHTNTPRVQCVYRTTTTTTPTPVATPPSAFVACEGRQEEEVIIWEEVGERLMMVYLPEQRVRV